MKYLMRAALIAAACVSFAGCQEIQKVADFVSGNNVTPQMVYIAANAFDAVEGTATNYLKLPLCATGGPTVCRTSAISAQVAQAIRAGRAARNTLEAAVNSGSSAPIPTSPYSVIKSETATLQALLQ